jgi:type IV secretion system protein VirD4
VTQKNAPAPPDDWSQLPARTGSSGRAISASSETDSDDPANAGIRREPELPEHEEMALEHTNPTPEFAFAEEDLDDETASARALRQQARGLARQAAMDPGDGTDL